MGRYNKIIELAKSFAQILTRYKQSLSVFIKDKKESLCVCTASASQLVPAVIRKPSVTWRWVFSSYWFYISVIVTLILMNTAVYSAVDTTLANIYPQVKTKKMFGLIVQRSDDPRIIWQRKILLGIIWAGACGLNAYVLLLSLPAVVRKTSLKARQNEAKADTMVTVKPSESILLYSKALKLAVDQDLESSLKSKINSLDDIIKSGNIGPSSLKSPAAPQPKGTGTIVLPANQSEQEDIVGPDGRYRIENELGHGAMGVVFLAKDQLLFRDVALKKLTAGLNRDQNIITRFQQEARALAQLSHPNIVQIYDLVQEADQYWIAMEYVEGTDLGTLIERKGHYPANDAVGICVQIAEAMDYAHNRGVVHRDFKPSNVLINQDGEPKVMDFGLAKLAHSSLATMEGSLLGSPAFMSPEQARGETADPRSDIYAMGVTLFQLLTGELPFEGDLKTVITKKIANRPPSMKALEEQAPFELVEIIKKMMANDPDDRHATMKDVGGALSSINVTDA
jgi:predicted Ser/Thr protein kinase